MASCSLLDVDQEQRNFFCLTILLYDVGNKSLREYFKKQWPVAYQRVKGHPPPAPWTNVPNDATEMKIIERKLKLKPNEQAKFDNGDTMKWDFSLLSSVLLHSSLGFLAHLPTGKKALEDLKDVRNELVGHRASCKIDEAEFKSAWTSTCNALKIFGATQTEFNSVEDVLKKPSEILVPILKECVKAEDIRDSISEFIEKTERNHEEILSKMSQYKEEVKAAIKEEGQLTRSSLEERSGHQSSRHILMAEDQRLLLKQRLPHFQNDVKATDLLENLPCLTDDQKNQIAYDEKNYLHSKGMATLVEKLEEHEDGFGQLVQALNIQNLGHVALLLDADFEDHKCDDKTKTDEEEAKYYTIVGTAVDVMILMRIIAFNQTRQLGAEQQIASAFSSSSSSESKDLRKNFQKVLPKGLHFVHTKQLGSEHDTREASSSSLPTSKKDSVVFVFRVAKASVLDELWKIYQDKTLDKKLHQILSSSKHISSFFSLEISFQEKDYIAVKRILEGTGGEPEAETESSQEPLNSSQDSKPALSDTEKAGPSKDDIQCVTKDSSSVTNTEGLPKMKCTQPIPRVYLDDGTHNLGRELKLRDYQKELAAPALEGKNTIICAPTNSGKTFVAMEITKRHLDAYKDLKDEACKNVPRPKVIFVVNKQNLVLQQRARFQEYLTNYSVSDISGNNSNVLPLHRLMLDNNVIVLTADILLNALRDKSVNISDITLLVFDECHHANKDHSYNQIMQVYLDLKIRKKVKDLPQVIGLSASLGVGQSNTADQAKEHILQMCANLDASNISTVSQNVEDLINNVTGHVPVRKVISPVNQDVQNIFEIEINKAMQEIEGFINQLRSNPRSSGLPTTDRQLEGYRQWIELLQNDPEIKDNRTKFTCADQLRKYHEALLINNTARVDDSINYLKEYFNKLDQSKFTNTCARLQDLYEQTMKRIEDHIKENGKPDNPQLKVLENLIVEFHDKNVETEAKGILFTRTRDNTVALKRWINETRELNEILRPEVLVGSGDGEIGLSQTQQEAVIKKFKSGDINIIIATTVAEEGLDISDCSYVIRYGMLGNEISSRQSRGRIRAKDGNYVCLPDSRRRGVERERCNDYREMLMDSALEEVQNIETSLFAERIYGLQIKSLDELELKKELEAERKSEFQEEDHIAFICKKCEKYVCSSRDIRRYKQSNHLVVNPSVEKLFVVKERDKPEGHKGRFNKFKPHCKECDLDWGIMLATQGIQWLCLKIEKFWIVFNNRWDEKRNIKRWKDVPFRIEDATLEQLFELRRRLGQNH